MLIVARNIAHEARRRQQAPMREVAFPVCEKAMGVWGRGRKESQEEKRESFEILC